MMFDEIFIARLGAKLIYHEMFKWYQIQHSAVKIDAGLTLGYLSLSICFSYQNVVTNILSSLNLVYCFLYIILNKRYLRKELKVEELSIIILRTVFHVYSIYLLYMNFENTMQYFTEGFGKHVSSIMFCLITIFLIIVWFSTFKCMDNFNKGFKKVLEAENNQETLANDSDNEY